MSAEGGLKLSGKTLESDMLTCRQIFGFGILQLDGINSLLQRLNQLQSTEQGLALGALSSAVVCCRAVPRRAATPA